jgi:hypothetical protein
MHKLAVVKSEGVMQSKPYGGHSLCVVYEAHAPLRRRRRAVSHRHPRPGRLRRALRIARQAGGSSEHAAVRIAAGDPVRRRLRGLRSRLQAWSTGAADRVL